MATDHEFQFPVSFKGLSGPHAGKVLTLSPDELTYLIEKGAVVIQAKLIPTGIYRELYNYGAPSLAQEPIRDAKPDAK